MNKFFLAAVLAALVSSPALAKTTHVHKRTVSHSHAWLQPSVHGAQARYLGDNSQIDLQLGTGYEQRP